MTRRPPFLQEALHEMCSRGPLLRSAVSVFTAMHVSCGGITAWLARWLACVTVTGAAGGHFVWQTRYLVNLDDVLKPAKRLLCERVVINCWVWMRYTGIMSRGRWTSDASGSFFVAGAILLKTPIKKKHVENR